MVGDQKIYEPAFLNARDRIEKEAFAAHNIYANLHSGISASIANYFLRRSGSKIRNSILQERSMQTRTKMNAASRSFYGCSSTGRHKSQYSKIQSDKNEKSEEIKTNGKENIQPESSIRVY